MPGLTIKRRINVSPHETFVLFTDLAHAAENISGITKLEKLTEGPVGVGTQFRETRKIMNKEATEQMAFTAFEPGKSYRVECDSHGTSYMSTFRFDPVESGTEVTVDFQARPVTFAAKLMAPLGWMMMGMTRKCIEKDLDDLKQVAESKEYIESA